MEERAHYFVEVTDTLHLIITISSSALTRLVAIIGKYKSWIEVDASLCRFCRQICSSANIRSMANEEASRMCVQYGCIGKVFSRQNVLTRIMNEVAVFGGRFIYTRSQASSTFCRSN